MSKRQILAAIAFVVGMVGCTGKPDYEPKNTPESENVPEGDLAAKNGFSETDVEGNQVKSRGDLIDDILKLQDVLKQVNVALGGSLEDDPDPEDVLRRVRGCARGEKLCLEDFNALKKQLKIDEKSSSEDALQVAKKAIEELDDIKSTLGGGGGSGPSKDPAKDVRDLMSKKDNLEKDRKTVMSTLTAYFSSGTAPTSIAAGVKSLIDDLRTVEHIASSTGSFEFTTPTAPDPAKKVGLKVYDKFVEFRTALGSVGNDVSDILAQATTVTTDLATANTDLATANTDLANVDKVLDGTTKLDGGVPATTRALATFNKFKAIYAVVGGNTPDNILAQATTVTTDLDNVEKVLDGTTKLDGGAPTTIIAGKTFDKFETIRAVVGGDTPDSIKTQATTVTNELKEANTDLNNIGGILDGSISLGEKISFKGKAKKLHDMLFEIGEEFFDDLKEVKAINITKKLDEFVDGMGMVLFGDKSKYGSELLLELDKQVKALSNSLPGDEDLKSLKAIAGKVDEVTKDLNTANTDLKTATADLDNIGGILDGSINLGQEITFDGKAEELHVLLVKIGEEFFDGLDKATAKNLPGKIDEISRYFSGKVIKEETRYIHASVNELKEQVEALSNSLTGKEDKLGNLTLIAGKVGEVTKDLETAKEGLKTANTELKTTKKSLNTVNDKLKEAKTLEDGIRKALVGNDTLAAKDLVSTFTALNEQMSQLVRGDGELKNMTALATTLENQLTPNTFISNGSSNNKKSKKMTVEESVNRSNRLSVYETDLITMNNFLNNMNKTYSYTIADIGKMANLLKGINGVFANKHKKATDLKKRLEQMVSELETTKKGLKTANNDLQTTNTVVAGVKILLGDSTLPTNQLVSTFTALNKQMSNSLPGDEDLKSLQTIAGKVGKVTKDLNKAKGKLNTANNELNKANNDLQTTNTVVTGVKTLLGDSTLATKDLVSTFKKKITEMSQLVQGDGKLDNMTALAKDLETKVGSIYKTLVHDNNNNKKHLQTIAGKVDDVTNDLNTANDKLKTTNTVVADVKTSVGYNGPVNGLALALTGKITTLSQLVQGDDGLKDMTALATELKTKVGSLSIKLVGKKNNNKKNNLRAIANKAGNVIASRDAILKNSKRVFGDIRTALKGEYKSKNPVLKSKNNNISMNSLAQAVANIKTSKNSAEKSLKQTKTEKNNVEKKVVYLKETIDDIKTAVLLGKYDPKKVDDFNPDQINEKEIVSRIENLFGKVRDVVVLAVSATPKDIHEQVLILSKRTVQNQVKEKSDIAEEHKKCIDTYSEEDLKNLIADSISTYASSQKFKNKITEKKTNIELGGLLLDNPMTEEKKLVKSEDIEEQPTSEEMIDVD